LEAKPLAELDGEKRTGLYLSYKFPAAGKRCIFSRQKSEVSFLKK
jgi:hypothetical protein